jgi:hypothetical protein
LARFNASVMTTVPNSAADSALSEPPKEPMAVRVAETMTMSDMSETPKGSGKSEARF